MSLFTRVYRKQSGGSIAYTEQCVTDLPWGFTGPGVAVTESGSILRQSVLTLTAIPITVTDNGANGGNGSQLLYTFPIGLVQVLGATANVNVTAATGIAANAALIMSVGTIPAANDNETLTLTEADIIPSTAATLTASAGNFSGISTAAIMAAGVFYHHTTAKAAYLNAIVPNAGITSNSTLTVSGTVRITWISLGDV